MDTVLLASWVRIRAGKFRFVELGSAAGAVSLMLALRFRPMLNITGIELQKDLNNLAEKNRILNNLEAQTKFINGDLRDKNLFPCEYFDGVVANPPYESLERGRKSADISRSIARQDIFANISDITEAASRLLKSRGRFFAVFRTERMARFINSLLLKNLVPKRIKFVHPRRNEASNIFLIECVKNGGEGVKIEPPLFVLDDNNNYTQELLNAYDYPDTDRQS